MFQLEIKKPAEVRRGYPDRLSAMNAAIALAYKGLEVRIVEVHS